MSIRTSFRDVKRAETILRIIAKHGLDAFFHERSWRQFFVSKKATTIEQSDLPRHLRLALEELGPTFIKFGQILSTRPDLIPQQYITELSKLQDAVPPSPLADIEEEFIHHFGAKPATLFKTFNPKPVASASLSQVYRATLPTGEVVACKVKRPNIDALVASDLDILDTLAEFFNAHQNNDRLIDPKAIVADFRHQLERELDFTIEAQHCETFARHFEGDDTVKIPRVYREWTNREILTMEFIRGTRILDIQKKDKQFDRPLLAARGADAILKQIFTYGFFHGDPHPGNLFVLKGNRIAFLDFGIVGRIDATTRGQMARLLLALVNQDTRGVIRTLEEMEIITDDMDTAAIEVSVQEFLDRYYGAPLKDISMAALAHDVIAVMIAHRIHLPTHFVLLLKSLSMLETVGTLLDPTFVLPEHVKPFVEKLVLQQYAPHALLEQGLAATRESMELLTHLPEDVRSLIQKLKKGELGINLEHKGLDQLVEEVDRSSNEVAFAAIIAALVVAGALLMRIDAPPSLFGMPFLALVSFTLAAILGFSLWKSMRESRKRREE
ncbi:phosphotransferase [Candidatus Uhrbacteria bacterium]|nr:phosphotransferase [Candidatus Uhrbacteria bacterium]